MSLGRGARLALVVLALGSSATARESDHPAAARVRSFLQAHGNQSGLPDEKGLDSMRGFLGHRLQALMECAKARQRRFMREHPSDKPPFIEGNLFHSVVFEDFEDFKVGSPKMLASGAYIVPVTFRIEKRYWTATEQQHWMDQYVLSNEEGSWRVSDVIFLDDAPFGKGRATRLRAQLEWGCTGIA